LKALRRLEELRQHRGEKLGGDVVGLRIESATLRIGQQL
jgi:hypothetical protein